MWCRTLAVTNEFLNTWQWHRKSGAAYHRSPAQRHEELKTFSACYLALSQHPNSRFGKEIDLSLHGVSMVGPELGRERDAIAESAYMIEHN